MKIDALVSWQAAVAKGEGQLDRGEADVYSPDLMERLTQAAIAAMHSGEPIDPDVLQAPPSCRSFSGEA
jgi:hypothetical protein